MTVDILWIQKYEPKTIKDIIINIDKLNSIKTWLDNFNNDNYPGSIIITGNHGVGKNISINILLKTLGYNIKLLSSNNVKNKKTIKDIIDSCKSNKNVYNILINNNSNKYALIIDNTETISLSSEKDCLLELLKLNDKEKILPIIFISNNNHSKLISDIKKNSTEYLFNNPTYNELLIIFNKIVSNEKMNIKDPKIINSIIRYSQNDIRRLIFILQDLYFTYEKNDITVERLQKYFNHSQKKDIEIGLYEATSEILNNYKSINKCMEFYETEKVLLPLMIYENYHKLIFNKKDNNILEQLKISNKVSDSISKGDVIETNIYTDQNWINQCIHGFYTICDTSYNINTLINKNQSYSLDFSADLNKTSLKNINRKNIINLQSIFLNKSLDDMLYINKLIYALIKKKKFKEAYAICKDYPVDIKYLEIIIKIDKTIDKLVITPKMKKLLC